MASSVRRCSSRRGDCGPAADRSEACPRIGGRLRCSHAFGLFNSNVFGLFNAAHEAWTRDFSRGAHRLRRSLHSDTSCFLVAQSASEVIGLVSAELLPYFPNGSTICRVTGLVGSTHHRGQGILRKLVIRSSAVV